MPKKCNTPDMINNKFTSQKELPILNSAKPSAFLRAAKIILAEVNFEYNEVIDPNLEMPILVRNGSFLTGVISIGEELMGGDARIRFNVEYAFRWLIPAFDGIFQNRVLCFQEKKVCNSQRLAKSREDLSVCLNMYLDDTFAQFEYMGENFSYADAIWAGFISYLDYLDEIKWDSMPKMREWYSLIKSRPCFAHVLKETIPGIQPSAQYSIIDF